MASRVEVFILGVIGFGCIGLICGEGAANDDWFVLGTYGSGISADVEIQYPGGLNGIGEAWAELDIDFWCGTKWCAAATGSNNRTTFTGSCSAGSCLSADPVTVRVYSNEVGPQSGTPYTILRH